MTGRIRSRRGGGEDGFTLVELLVVVVIIGILAAIAIPTFMGQRQKAWERAVQSDLRNAAIQMQVYYSNTGSFSGATSALFKTTDDVTLTVKAATDTDYCLDGASGKLPATDSYFFSSGPGTVSAGTCP